MSDDDMLLCGQLDVLCMFTDVLELSSTLTEMPWP